MQFVIGYFNVIDFKCRDMIYQHAIKGKSFIIHDILITCTSIRLKLAIIDGHLNKSSFIQWLLNVCQLKLHGIQITVKCSNPFSIEILSIKVMPMMDQLQLGNLSMNITIVAIGRKNQSVDEVVMRHV